MKKSIIFTFILFLLLSAVGCGAKDELQEVSKNLSHYNINIDFDVENKSAECSQTVLYVNNSTDILRQVKFHLYPQFFEEGATSCVISSTKLNDAYPNGMSYAEFEVTRVVVDGVDAGILYEGEHDGILNVPLNNSLVPNDNVEIVIDYNFVMPNCQHRFGYGDDTINLANFYPIACVYDKGEFSVNPYNANGDPFYSDIANYAVNLTVDDRQVVASTGEQTIISNRDGKTEYLIKEIAVRDFACVMSDKFEVINTSYKDTTIEYYYYNDANAQRSLQAGVDAIATFSRFGDYPYQRFSIVQADFVHGGMEYPGLIYISDVIKNEDDYLNVIIHETAHQWWYAMVGNDEYTEPWLDEALTEYSTILFYDMNDGYNFNHADMIKASKENYTLFITVYKDVLGDIDTSMRPVDEYDTEPEYTYCTYVKGVLMFDSLYSLVGEKDFLSALERYFKDNKYTNATVQDLITSFEDECRVDLDEFFSSWLDGKVVIR